MKNKKLKEELSKYKKHYEHSMGFSDFGGYDNVEGDDELIYEEGLYD